MSHVAFDYLNDSVFFHDYYIREQFSKLSDAQIRTELQKYREYILSHMEALFEEISETQTRLSTQFPIGEGIPPSEELLKQTALYMDRVFVSDVLFEHTQPQDDIAHSFAGFLDLPDDRIDRTVLTNDVRYMKSLTSSVAADYVKFVPLSYWHEPSGSMPLLYSPTGFSDALDSSVLNYCHERVKISPLIKSEDGWYISDEPLTPCRHIIIGFTGHTREWTNSYHLLDQEHSEFDDETNQLKSLLTLPDTPLESDRFEWWAFQSVNQAAKNVVDAINEDVRLSGLLGAMYLTQSEFAYGLLNVNPNVKQTLTTDIANLTMKLELPVLEETTLERIIDIRSNYGESFQNFRIELEKNLRDLRTIDNPEKMRIALENVQHELMQVQVNDMKQSLVSLRKEIPIQVFSIATGTMLTSLPFHRPNLMELVVPAAQSSFSLWRKIKRSQRHPGYFLWKVSKTANKTT